MQFIIFVIIACFIIFLYVLYFLSRDDFVIVRKDIQMDRIFNLAFFTFFFALFSARLFHIIISPSKQLLNPINFFAIPYIPGLSLLGGIIGGSIFVYIYANLKKMPAGKLLDLFVISLTAALPIGFLGAYILFLGKTNLFFNVMFIFSVILFFIFNKFIYSFSVKGEIKDGTLGLVFMLIFSFVYFTTRMLSDIKSFSLFDLENIILFITLFSSLILILNQEMIDKFLPKK